MNRALVVVVLICVAACALPAQSALDGFIPFGAGPEGVAVDKAGNVYVSIGPVAGDDQILKFAPNGDASVFATIPGPSYACGLAVDAAGNVYMARPAVPSCGVYKVTPSGQVSKLEGTGQIIGGDALAFDQRGNLYISEIFSIDPATGGWGPGGIWRVPKGGGPAELWLRHELLTGFGPTLFPFPVGANGIIFYHGALYVCNTEKCMIVRIPVLPDGSPGEPEVWATVVDRPEFLFYNHPFFLLMIDGISMDVHGNAYVPIPSRNAIVRINAIDKSQDTIAYYPQTPLDAPLSMAFGMAEGERQSLFVTNSGMMGLFVQGVQWPGPALVKIDVGIPGLPLP